MGISSFDPSQAQVIPDGTLSTKVSTSDQRQFSITQGRQVGRNLFHSFEQFNIPSEGSAFFDNPSGVQNIITRITGGSASRIDGVIGANGSSNLFLLNPSGVVFGPNAALNLGGSFVASSATSLVFADGVQFSAQPTATASLLTMSVPTGLQFGATPGSLVNQSRAPNRLGMLAGLQVLPDHTLALIGGEIVLDGGMISTFGGQVSLGSVANDSFVNIQPGPQGWRFTYQPLDVFSDIRLTDLAVVNTSGFSGGKINVQGKNVILTGGSKFLANTFGSEAGGRIVVDASESVQVLGTTSIPNLFEPFEKSVGILIPVRSGISSNTFGAGKAGDITINTKALSVRDGAQITSASFGPFGTGGNLTVNASDSVTISGTSTLFNPLVDNARNTVSESRASEFNDRFFLELNTASALGTVSASTGPSGNLLVTTGQLVTQGGGLLSTTAFGPGAGGTLKVDASESVVLSGTSSSGVVSSGLFSPTITTGVAGDLIVDTRKLDIRNGARIAASTLGSGPGGTVKVKASEYVLLDGRSANGIYNSGLFSQSLGTGNAGSLQVETGDLSISNGAGIALDSQQSGLGGSISVLARTTTLDTNAFISTETDIGQGGNIQLNIAEYFILSQGSRTSATAGRALSAGDGGNITISTPLLIALEDSQITAEAFSGRGGNIKIVTQEGLFQSADSTISASSQLDDDGTVLINTPETDPNDSTNVLPEKIAISPEISQSCQTSQSLAQGQFIHSGRGGLPPRPTDLRSSQAIWHDIRAPRALATLEAAPVQTSQPIPAPKLASIVEAKGWVKTSQGMTLVVPEETPMTVARLSSKTC